MIDNWRLIQTEANAVLIGRVSGRPRTPDGAIVVTSPVSQLDEGAGTATTRSGTVYRLGVPWSADEALPDGYRRALIQKMAAAGGGTLTESRLAAISAVAARCCRAGAKVDEAILARLRPVSMSWNDVHLRAPWATDKQS
ncbi:hypothetical protein DS843_22875 [Roseomonas genomospecies 6]|uniref:Uncharacterized protein n=1 Tax=Roseomonas genomospecies 6 TaxID=214106 RepID=A0A9W7KQG3_9PROT|nr:hypothetical protein DS843_22875 [Roseomonas genomospecies 6]